jgi:hypothetical protein
MSKTATLERTGALSRLYEIMDVVCPVSCPVAEGLRAIREEPEVDEVQYDRPPKRRNLASVLAGAALVGFLGIALSPVTALEERAASIRESVMTTTVAKESRQLQQALAGPSTPEILGQPLTAADIQHAQSDKETAHARTEHLMDGVAVAGEVAVVALGTIVVQGLVSNRRRIWDGARRKATELRGWLHKFNEGGEWPIEPAPGAGILTAAAELPSGGYVDNFWSMSSDV